MESTLNLEQFEQFIADYPVFEYRLFETDRVSTETRVREICRSTCPRYGKSWACPPAVGTLAECEERIRSFSHAVFFSTVAEVSDVMNMEETLSTRHAHEEITNALAEHIREQGFEVFVLSTESCDICPTCAYKQGKPCNHPEYMHPCLESHGVVVMDLVEREAMEYNIGGNTILWFSMVLFR